MPFTCPKCAECIILIARSFLNSFFLLSDKRTIRMHVTRRLFDENMHHCYISCLVNRSRVRLVIAVRMLALKIIMPKKISSLTYIDAPDWLQPTSDDLWSEQPVVECTHAYTLPAFRAKTLAYPCRSCTRYAALGGGDAHYSWSHTARSSHACHRRHPRKTLPKQN